MLFLQNSANYGRNSLTRPPAASNYCKTFQINYLHHKTKYLLRKSEEMFRFRPAVQSIAKSSKVLFTPANNFATYKTSTGLVGLAVDANGRETLQKISEQILQSVKVKNERLTITRVGDRNCLNREFHRVLSTETTLKSGSPILKMFRRKRAM